MQIAFIKSFFMIVREFDHYIDAGHGGDEEILDGLEDAAELLRAPRIRAALVELADGIGE